MLNPVAQTYKRKSLDLLRRNSEEIAMPAKSAKQYRFMQMMAHNPEKKRGNSKGPSPELAKEFISKTSAAKRKQFARKED
jgi:hypothetical protein